MLMNFPAAAVKTTMEVKLHAPATTASVPGSSKSKRKKPIPSPSGSSSDEEPANLARTHPPSISDPCCPVATALQTTIETEKTFKVPPVILRKGERWTQVLTLLKEIKDNYRQKTAGKAKKTASTMNRLSICSLPGRRRKLFTPH